MNEEMISGLVAIAGETEVFVAPMPNDVWAIRFITGDNVTRLNLKHETVSAMLALMGRQGGFVIPGSNTRVIYQSTREDPDA